MTEELRVVPVMRVTYGVRKWEIPDTAGEPERAILAAALHDIDEAAREAELYLHRGTFVVPGCEGRYVSVVEAYPDILKSEGRQARADSFIAAAVQDSSTRWEQAVQAIAQLHPALAAALPSADRLHACFKVDYEVEMDPCSRPRVMYQPREPNRTVVHVLAAE